MRQISFTINLLSISLFLFISIGCNKSSNKNDLSQDDIKLKELNLREKELDLKERELNLKEDSIKNIVSLPVKNKTDVKNITTDNNSESANTTQANALSYNFDKHYDIITFINDLAKAVTSKDKSTVAQMTNFPFKDYLGDDILYKANNGKSFSSKNSLQFIENYDGIFITNLIKVIEAKKYREGKGGGSYFEDIADKGEYIIEANQDDKRIEYILVIKKVNGIYKLCNMMFHS